MSGFDIPVTDAFDDDGDLKSVEVNLSTDQLAWLRSRAEELDISLDHVLRSVINAQIRLARSNDDRSTSERGGSVVDSLRSANERLQKMTDRTRTRTEETTNTLSRLRARLGDGAHDSPPLVQPSSRSDDASTEAPDAEEAESTPESSSTPSMFDMMKE